MKSIFVSSTFRDMQYERDMIQSRVLPELQDFAGKYGRTVDFIDLRWGVDTSGLQDDESGRKVLSVCLDEIEKSRPYMIVLLGERYGWMPEEKLIRRTAEEKQFRQESFDESVTALEIEYGALKNRDQLDHCIFCFRDPQILNEIDGKDRDSYAAESPVHGRKLAALKEKIREACPDQIYEYQAQWDPEKERICGLEGLEHELTERIEALLRKEWGPAEIGSWQEQEMREAARFTAERGERFSVREEELAECMTAAEDPATKLVLIRGEPGSGKSTMMSMLDAGLREKGGKVLTVISGNSARSSTTFDVLRQMTYFMEELLGKEHDGDKDKDLISCRRRFQELGYEYGKKFDEPVYILVDGLDQLLKDDIRGKALWLPPAVPGNTTLIMSCLSDFESAQDLPYKEETKVFELGELSEDQIRSLSRRRLADHHKDTDAGLIDAIAGKAEAGNPLYLSLLIQRLLMMDSEDFTEIGRRGDDMQAIAAYLYETVQNSPEVLEALCADILREAAQRINVEQCTKTVELIAVSRHGLREKDLRQIFENEGRDYSAVDTALLLKYMRPMFGEREDGRIDFSHRTIREGFRKRIGDEETLEADRQICGALGQLPDDDGMKLREYYHHCFKCDHKAAAAAYIKAAKKDLQNEQIQILAEAVRESFLSENGDWLAGISERCPGVTEDFYEFLIFPFYDCFTRSAAETDCLRPVVEAAYRSLKESCSKNETAWKDRLLALLAQKNGDLLSLSGKLTEAEPFYCQYYLILKELAERLQTPEAKDDYAACCENLGARIEETGELEQAEAYYLQSYEISREMMEQHGKPKWQTRYARSCLKLSDLAVKAGRMDKAQAYCDRFYRSAKELMERQNTEIPMRDFAVSCERKGDLALQSGEVKQADLYYSREHELFKDLMERTRTPESMRSYSSGCEKMALIAECEGCIEKEEYYYRLFYENNKKLMEKLGTPGARFDYAVSCEKMGKLAEIAGDRKQAEAYYRMKYDIFKELMEQLRTPESKKGYVSSCMDLGSLAYKCGEVKQTEDYFLQSSKVSEELMRQLNTPESRRGYALSCQWLGELAEKSNELKKAKRFFRRFYEITEDLAKQPGTVEAKCDHAVSCFKLGSLAEQSGEWNLAEKYYLKSYSVLNELQQSVQTSEIKSDYAASCAKLGIAKLMKRRIADGYSYLSKASVLFGELADKGDSQAKENLAVVNRILNDLRK